MQNTTSLNSLQEQVSTTKRLLETKSTLNEVFSNFFLSDNFVQSNDTFRNDVVFLATLFNDLLDDLFKNSMQKQLSDAGIK